jgi:hypothetical protein
MVWLYPTETGFDWEDNPEKPRSNSKKAGFRVANGLEGDIVASKLHNCAIWSDPEPRGERTMPVRSLPRHEGLATATRLPGRREAAIPVLEWTALLLFGGLAASAVVFMDWGLRVPGHAILRAVFPMVCGLALVPRRGAGTVMAGGALLALGWMRLGGFGSPGTGATASLLLTGPMMDLALWSAKPGFRLYLSFALAGFAANFLAFVIRGSAKYLGGPGAGGRGFEGWFSVAIVTYAACGRAAGVISAVVMFHWAGPRDDQSPPEPA